MRGESMTRDIGDRGSVKDSAAGGRGGVPLWVGIVVIVGAFLMALGGVIALVKPGMMLAPHDAITEGVVVYAGYLVARNLAVALFLLIALALRARGQLSLMVLLAGCIQLFDAVLDLKEGRWTLVPGVSILGLVFLLAAARLSGFAFWKAGAWRGSVEGE